MLRAVPKSWFSPDYKVLESNTVIATVALSLLREAGELTVAGSTCRVYREGLLAGSFVLESASSILARADKPSAFYRSFQVKHDDKEYTLGAESAGFRKFVLSEGGKQIGSVYPEHPLTRKSVIDFPEDIPLVVRVFIFWLVMILWKRATDAAAAN
jgi:hypothetical protein